jgi:hypothetical protein
MALVTGGLFITTLSAGYYYYFHDNQYNSKENKDISEFKKKQLLFRDDIITFKSSRLNKIKMSLFKKNSKNTLINELSGFDTTKLKKVKIIKNKGITKSKLMTDFEKKINNIRKLIEQGEL